MLLFVVPPGLKLEDLKLCLRRECKELASFVAPAQVSSENSAAVTKEQSDFSARFGWYVVSAI
jgi:hypothetical protein